jgi:hypothetical protein
VTGLRHARHEHVVIADDDVRWTASGLASVDALLDVADLVRPQNVFFPLPWHARWDTARSLVNRAFGADYPGTYGIRRSTFLAAGGYDGDVLFENLELSRTLRAAGATETYANALFVVRRPPRWQHFIRQRVRQSYDDLAQPGRLVAECALLPAAATVLVAGLRGSRAQRLALWSTLPGLAAVSVAIAEYGRRRAGGAAAFPRSAAIWAPLWLSERAVCVWVALAHRAVGGTPYAGQRLRIAAHSLRWLRKHRAGIEPLIPAYDDVPSSR